MNSEKRVLIIVPAYNEEAAVGPLIREIRNGYPHFTVLVVNDASTDKTSQVAEASGAMVIDHPYNLGIGGTIQTGIRIALEQGYDIAVQIDGDGQHDPSSLSDLLKPLFEDRLDLVIGSRFLSQSPNFKSTLMRRFGIGFFAGLLSYFTGTRLTDPTSGYRAMNKSLLTKFAGYYPSDFPEPEAIQMAKRYGARIGEVAVRMRERMGGVSSIRNLKTLYYMVKVTLAILIDTLKKRD